MYCDGCFLADFLGFQHKKQHKKYLIDVII